MALDIVALAHQFTKTAFDFVTTVLTPVYYHVAGEFVYNTETGLSEEENSININTSASVTGGVITGDFTAHTVSTDYPYIKVSGFETETNNGIFEAVSVTETEITLAEALTDETEKQIEITGFYHQADALLTNFTLSERRDETILATDTKMQIRARSVPFVPKPGDHILKADGTRWDVVNYLYFAPVDSIYKLQLRRP